uniref:Uncharacterized protein n=1 Tax=Kwoniella pini CBS 10737 TaxID=1296096 RepID=A0A1B9I2W5_9TREE|nr:uncharacterized protein I206_04372 [Kwoniella pini CBS 10737]OCF49845.1 hypothetical protein I206_04372 [Kwoniella pini CBS 10737]
MPLTATKGVRGRFYRELAQQTKEVEVYVAPIGVDVLSTRNSEEPIIRKLSPLPQTRFSRQIRFPLPNKPITNYAMDVTHKARERKSLDDNDDDGWGSPPVLNSDNHNNPKRDSIPQEQPNVPEDRAELTKRTHLLSKAFDTPSKLISRSTQLSQHNRSDIQDYSSKVKVNSWIPSSSFKEAPFQRPDGKPFKRLKEPTSLHSVQPSNIVAEVTTSHTPSKKGKGRDRMNYSHQDMPSISYRRYDGSYIPPPVTDPFKSYTDQRQSLSNDAIHFPSTNPFVNRSTYQSGGHQSTHRPTDVNEFEAFEREKQVALARAQEMQRKIDEGTRSVISFPYPSHKADDNQTTSLRTEIIHLNNLLNSQRDQLSYKENKILELETRILNHKNEIESILKERDQLNTLSISLEKKLEEEKIKRNELELQVDSSKKGQSSLAKHVQSLEIKLRDIEEKEKLSQQGKDRFEKRVKDLENDAQLIKNLNETNAKATNAYREKEGTIVKLRAKEHDNAKLSDKLNLIRRENQALQSVIEELKEDLEKETNKKGDPVAWKKLKEELQRERSTSDRIRLERNTIREQLAKFKKYYQDLKSSERVKINTINEDVINSNKIEIYQPEPTLINQHKPKFSLDNIGSGSNSRPEDEGKEVIEVISDKDGVEYEGRRISIQENLDKEEKLENFQAIKIEERKEEPKFTMNSIPLQPDKIEIPPTREEIGLFSPFKDFYLSKKIVNTDQEGRTKWLKNYALGLKEKKEDEFIESQTCNPSEKRVDPFADLDPLDERFSSIKSSNVPFYFDLEQNSSSRRNLPKTLDQELKDLMISPKSMI